MLQKGAAKKLVIYVNVKHHRHGVPLYESIVQFLRKHGVHGATVTKAVAGYGASGRVHESHVFSVTNDVPMRIEAVDSEQKLNELLPFLYEMVDKGLLVLSDVEMIKYPHSARLDEPR